MVAACHEEIINGHERYGLVTLLGIFTGFRKRILVHFTDDWLHETEDGLEIHLPKQVRCTINDNGCRYCNYSKSRGPDGFLRPKTAAGEQRTVPVPATWYDTFEGVKKETKLPEYLDVYFTTNSSWGFERASMDDAVKTVALRRHKTLRDDHQGEEMVNINGVEKVAPDVIVHDLRATWCGQCLRMGVNETTIKDWFGWSDNSMIETYRSFIGDPTGSERAKVEHTEDDDNGSTAEVIEVLAEKGLLNTDDADEEALKSVIDGL
jgi:hypothetical protein